MAEPRKPVRIIGAPDAVPAFSNTTQVTVSDDSVIFQFAFVRPSAEDGRLVSEVILSPKHAIEFSRALDATLKKHFTRHLQEPTEKSEN